MKKRSEPEAWPCHCGDHWWAPLTKGFITMVSPQDADLIRDKIWTALVRRSMSVVYAKRNVTDNKTVFLHREVRPDSVQVDHRNRNGLDNRRENVRAADASLNAANRGKPTVPNPSSSFRGVHLITDRPLNKPWYVRCSNRHVGYFATEAEAAEAYDKAARELFGEFAGTNGA